MTPRRTLSEGQLTASDSETIARRELRTFSASTPIVVRHDEDVLGLRFYSKIANLGLSPRYRGWCTQQLVKVLAVMQEETSASLVVDSDTILNYPHVWLAETGQQLLCIGQECREIPFNDSSSFLNIPFRAKLSFVTHHYLWQREILDEIFPEGKLSVEKWLDYANPKEPEDQRGFKLNDYETKGAFLSITHSSRVKFAAWGNGTGTRGQLTHPDVAQPVPSWPLSISYHHYRSANETDPGMF